MVSVPGDDDCWGEDDDASFVLSCDLLRTIKVTVWYWKTLKDRGVNFLAPLGQRTASGLGMNDHEM